MWSREVGMGLGLRVVVAGAACAGWLASVGPSEAGPPALLAEARYIALGYDLGTGFVADDPRVDVLPEERTALQRIRAGLDTWNKYVVVLRPGDADLLIAVRKGRLVSVGGGRHTFVASRRGPGRHHPVRHGPALLAGRHDRGLRPVRNPRLARHEAERVVGRGPAALGVVSRRGAEAGEAHQEAVTLGAVPDGAQAHAAAQRESYGPCTALTAYVSAESSSTITR